MLEVHLHAYYREEPYPAGRNMYIDAGEVVSLLGAMASDAPRRSRPSWASAAAGLDQIQGRRHRRVAELPASCIWGGLRSGASRYLP